MFYRLPGAERLGSRGNNCPACAAAFVQLAAAIQSCSANSRLRRKNQLTTTAALSGRRKSSAVAPPARVQCAPVPQRTRAGAANKKQDGQEASRRPRETLRRGRRPERTKVFDRVSGRPWERSSREFTSNAGTSARRRQTFSVMVLQEGARVLNPQKKTHEANKKAGRSRVA